MKLASFIALVAALEDAGVRYLVAGGLAVNAHGYQRFTEDVDLVIQLRPDNIIAAFRALATKGYKPSVPITAEDFANAALREQWITTKGMTVLNFDSDSHALTSVDVFVTEPFEFDREYQAVNPGHLVSGLPVRFVSIPTLIKMKELVGRPRDADDIQHLKWILEELEKSADPPSRD